MICTNKHLRAYLAIRSREFMGLPSFNDGYNQQVYGIDAATWHAINGQVGKAIGIAGERPKTIAALRSFLSR